MTLRAALAVAVVPGSLALPLPAREAPLWTFRNRHYADHCLTVGKATAVLHATCRGWRSQQWKWVRGMLQNRATGRCLTSETGERRTAVRAGPCRGPAPGRRWTFAFGLLSASGSGRLHLAAFGWGALRGDASFVLDPNAYWDGERRPGPRRRPGR